MPRMTLFNHPPRPGTTVLWAALLCAIWGTTFAMIRVGLRETPPLLGVAARFGVASLCLLLLTLWLRAPFRFGRTRWLYLAHGTLSFAIAYGVTYWAEERIPSGLAALIYTTYPLLIALLAHFAIPGEQLSRRSVLGLALGFAGLLGGALVLVGVRVAAA